MEDRLLIPRTPSLKKQKNRFSLRSKKRKIGNSSQRPLEDQMGSYGVLQWGVATPADHLKEHDQRLCDACRAGDFEKAKKALSDGANPSVLFKEALGESSPIFLCAAQGNQDIAKLLSECGADIHRTMEFDGTICLHHAARKGHSKMCEYLISRGCNVDHRDELGRTALMDAADIGCVQVIHVLVKNGATVDLQDEDEHTALSYCLDFVSMRQPRFYESAVCLINHGANPNYSGKFSRRTLLHYAAAQGDLELIQQLIKENDAAWKIKDYEGKSPMEVAMAHQHVEIVEYLQQVTVSRSVCCLWRNLLRNTKSF